MGETSLPEESRSDAWASGAVLGVWGTCVADRNGRWFVNHSFGRIVDRLARRFREVRYFGPRASDAAAEACDYPLASPNIRVTPCPAFRNSLDALKRPDRLLRQYWRMTRCCDALFLRGSLPFLWIAHWMARGVRRPVVHWIVGNPVAIMKGEKRGYGVVLGSAGLQLARFERTMTRIARRVSDAHLLTNGAELARIFRSPRTHEVVSTSITDDDFLHREDTCEKGSIRLLFVGFIRPEKGLEYLIRALPAIKMSKPLHLAVVGASDQFAQERARLQHLAIELGMASAVTWEGYARFGADLFGQMDRSDILILPSLSEGTPRVLVEARARSLPVISTNVGGIPSSVTHGEDGLLVPPRDTAALVSAVTRIIQDGDLRRRLIHNGRERMRRWTVDRFVDLLVELLGTHQVSHDVVQRYGDRRFR